ncbi:MAG: hypothetical protein EBV03_06220, partial [Proteobacteria bacterium]|nr:hypothetical protein [Pseudomonadota bacterium]
KVHDRAGHERKMRGAGYETTMPPRDVLGQLQEYFERQGTPILSFTPENPRIRDRAATDMMERIAADVQARGERAKSEEGKKAATR